MDKDATGGFDGGLLVIACGCPGASIAILSTFNDADLGHTREQMAESPVVSELV